MNLVHPGMRPKAALLIFAIMLLAGCNSETPVTIEDRGHEWPADLIDVGQTIWGFFVQHPRMQ
jgi:hypothetical protein